MRPKARTEAAEEQSFVSAMGAWEDVADDYLAEQECVWRSTDDRDRLHRQIDQLTAREVTTARLVVDSQDE